MENAILENKNIFDVTDKIVIVSGAGSGLGKGYSHVFAEAGATVVCCDINETSVNQTAAEITADGGKAHAYACDVTDTDSIKNFVDQVYADFGRIDVLINNAGREYVEPYLEVSPEHFDMILNVNLRGAFFMAQAVAKYMKEQKSGKIINIGSLGAHIGIKLSSVYTAGKGAVMTYTKTMALELADYNIQVNSVSPGYYLTPMTQGFWDDEKRRQWTLESIPLGRVGTVRDLAGAMIFLASSASDYVTGADIKVDGGWLAK